MREILCCCVCLGVVWGCSLRWYCGCVMLCWGFGFLRELGMVGGWEVWC